MTTTNSRFQTVVMSVLLLALGMAVGWWLGRAQFITPEPTTAEVKSERAVLYWYDPMLPQHHFDNPGKSPFMDMDLVPKYASEDAAGNDYPDALKIDARITQNIGKREAVVERIALVSVIEASGLLAFNERDVALEQARSAGVVERVWPLAPGDVISVGQPLAEVLIPEWSAAQAEFLVLSAGADSTLVDAARARLRLLGMSVKEISELETTGRARQSFIVRSSRAGVLESLDVRGGMTLMPGQMLARIQGIDRVWLEVAVPERRASEVRAGGAARVQLAAHPGQTFEGHVAAVLPALDPATRTLRVRIELPNPRAELRAGMSAQVRMEADEEGSALAVPTEAIIRTGKRSLVMVALDAGGYASVYVELGREIDNRTVINAGLKEGQKIVASAQFLLDSEASLSGSLPRTAPTSSEPTRDSIEADTMQESGVQP